MMPGTNGIPKVAFLTDSFHEVNGAALTCRELAAYARRSDYPFFSVRFARQESFEDTDPFWTLEMRRGPLSVGVDPDLRFDLTFFRLREALEERLRRFQPDLIHVIGPGELGILGALAGYHLRIPLVASWHTNVHEYAARRGPFRQTALANRVEEFVLDQILRIYRRGVALLAPSPELVDLLHQRTGKPTFLMRRGVDSNKFSPRWRSRTDDAFVIGYVGRLMPEKGVRFFRKLEEFLLAKGQRNFRIFIAGWGSETDWLRHHLRHAEFHAILPPDELSRAYANMDVFVFPSYTDTFGNVVQEALASGVPAVVTDGGGPKTIVAHGVTGLVASSDEEACSAVLRLMTDPETRQAMGAAGRAQMLTRSWDEVFAAVYRVYAECLSGRALGATGTAP
jgi:glycosyltransferase involved in cell wall biosynthesis